MIDLRRIDTEIIKSYNLDTKMKRPNSKRFYHCVKTLCPIIYLVCLIVNFSCSDPKSEEYFVRQCDFVSDYQYNDTTKWAITCRVWGLLKYYHPNVTAGKFDWDKVLLESLEAISYVNTPDALNLELNKMLISAGEYSYKEDKEWNDSLKMNVNLSWLNSSFIDDSLKIELKKIASLEVKYPSFYGIDYEHIVLQNEKNYDFEVSSSQKSVNLRLLSFFRYWNVIYYFFPHKYLMDRSWDVILSEYIPKFIESVDSQSYNNTFLKLAATLNDGHAYLITDNESPKDFRDIIEKVDDITIVRVNAGELQKGDIISSIGKQNIKQVRDSLSVFTAASTQGNKDYRINCSIGQMIFGQKNLVKVLRGDKSLEINVVPVDYKKENAQIYRWISDGIGYVDLSQVTNKDINSLFEYLSEADGIIFDLRKAGPYKMELEPFVCHLFENKEIQLSSMVYPDLMHPGAFIWKKNFQTTIPDSLSCAIYKGKIVVLINESTQSGLETIALEIRNNCNSTLVGRTTSGALGRVTFVPLLGQRASFSNFALFSADGTELQRKGINPDIVVLPTIDAIRNGRDEILDAGIDFIKKQQM